jgi:hypothetical protein
MLMDLHVACLGLLNYCCYLKTVSPPFASLRVFFFLETEIVAYYQDQMTVYRRARFTERRVVLTTSKCFEAAS